MSRIKWEVRNIPLDQIDPDPRNPNRTHPEVLERIKKSLERPYGQFIPISVRDHPTDSGRFMIINGEQRWRAMKELGRSTIWVAYGGNVPDHLALEMMVNANELHGRSSGFDMAAVVQEIAKMSAEIGDFDWKEAFAFDEVQIENMLTVSPEEDSVMIDRIAEAQMKSLGASPPIQSPKNDAVVFRIAFSTLSKCVLFVNYVWERLYEEGKIDIPPKQGEIVIPSENLGDLLLDLFGIKYDVDDMYDL